MGCCGEKRTAWKRHQANVSKEPYHQGALNLAANSAKDSSLFRYTGSTSLSIKGAISNNIYSFRFKGDTSAIDIRDVPSMLAEPYLEKISTK